jgi:hypothetical protein
VLWSSKIVHRVNENTMAKKKATHIVEVEGEKYEIPTVVSGIVLTEEQKLKVAEVVCKMYAIDKYPILECLKACGIKSESTWHKWRHEVEAIEELYKNAKTKMVQARQVSLRERLLTSYEKGISGYKVQLTEREERHTEKGIVTIEKTKEQYVAPHATLIIFGMKATFPEEFGDVDKDNVTVNVHNRMKDRLSELSKEEIAQLVKIGKKMYGDPASVDERDGVPGGSK